MDKNYNKVINERKNLIRNINKIFYKVQDYIEDELDNHRAEILEKKITYSNFKLEKLEKHYKELVDFLNKKEEKEDLNEEMDEEELKMKLLVLKEKNIYLKKQSHVIYEYEQYINQYLKNQKIEKQELDNECNYLIEQINEAKFTSKPTKEEIELIKKEEELEKLIKEKNLLEQHIDKQSQQKEINEVRLRQLINLKNIDNNNNENNNNKTNHSLFNKNQNKNRKNNRYLYKNMFDSKNNIKEVRKLDNYYGNYSTNIKNSNDLWKKKDLLPFSFMHKKLPQNITMIDGEINQNKSLKNKRTNSTKIISKQNTKNSKKFEFDLKELEEYESPFNKNKESLDDNEKEKKEEEKKEEENNESNKVLIDNMNQELNWLEEESPGSVHNNQTENDNDNNNFDVNSGRKPFGLFKFN